MRFSNWNDRWLYQFLKLAEWKDNGGDVNDRAVWKNDKPLRKWLKHQRAHRGSHLLWWRRNLLNDLGIIWHCFDDAWEQRFQELLDFKRRFGHASVPKHWPENPQLSYWVSNQRHFTKGPDRRNPERRKRLEEIGCFVHRDDFEWERHFQQWRDWVRERGTTVIAESRTNRSLTHWVTAQREKKRLGKLDADKIRRLDEAGFRWTPITDQWEERFAGLEKFHAEHGHCDVPREWSEHPGLLTWCHTQRTHRNQGRLSADRVRRLDALGFDWSPMESRWMAMLEELGRYRAVYGHCRVAQTSRDHLELGRWVRRQRDARSRGVMPPERIEKLDALGFEWSPVRPGGPRREP